MEETALTNTTINSLLWTGDELFATGYSDVYWTTDDGDTWSSSGTGLESTGGIYAWAKKDNKLFVGANDGIYRSLNNGMTWQELTFSGNYVRAVAVKGSYVYAGYSGGARRTSDDGNTWVATTGLGGDVYHMHVVDDYVFIGTYNGGVARLSADDLAWTSASSGLTDLQIRGITSNGSDVFVGTSSQGIFRSIDCWPDMGSRE
ncbi:MAG: hypothetical protein IPM68_14675 [Flavobacteriales bacterium]|nr:hypothetical protein [Flavobacteriales bacterium]